MRHLPGYSKSRLCQRIGIFASALVLGSVLLGLVRSARAQEQPLVFTHGLFGTGLTWAATAQHLRQDLLIAPILPTTGWQSTFAVQAGNLHTALAGFLAIPAAGHSNGGLVLRENFRQHGSSGRVNRALTVGTPHAGAPLAHRVLSGDLHQYFAELLDALVDPFIFYENHDPAFRQITSTTGFARLLWAADHMRYVAQNYATIVQVTGMPAFPFATPDVLSQMVPGSSFIETLNSTTALANEAARVPTRVSIVTSMSPHNVLFRQVSSDPQGWIVVRTSLQYFSVLLYLHYSAHPDFFLRANAARWLYLAAHMHYFDVVWHSMIGSLLGFNSLGQAVVSPQDGILPIAAQAWPSASVHRERLWPTHNIPHKEQVNSGEMRALYREVLRDVLNIATRPPLAVSMSGPSWIDLPGQYTWTASVQGGIGSYSYQWQYSPDGHVFQNVSTGPAYSRSESYNTTYWLRVVVTSGAATQNATHYVTVAVSCGGEIPC